MPKKQFKKENDDKVNVDGKVVKVLPNAEYEIEIEVSNFKRSIIGYPGGKMRKNYIKLNTGDEVVVEMSPKYDLNKGRIVWKKGRNGEVPSFIGNTLD